MNCMYMYIHIRLLRIQHIYSTSTLLLIYVHVNRFEINVKKKTEFFNEETIAFHGNQIFRESVSRSFSKFTPVAFAIFLYSPLQDDITRIASPKSSPCSPSSSIDFEQLPEMFEEEEDPSSFAFAYDYSETTQLRSSSKSTGRRLIFSKFHNVSSRV